MAEFVEVIRQYTRMCKSNGNTCLGCELERERQDTCRGFLMSNPVRAEEIIMKWAAENPEKTMMDVFLEKFPSAPLEGGYPYVCARHVGFDALDANENGLCIAPGRECKGCWNRPAPEEYQHE